MSKNLMITTCYIATVVIGLGYVMWRESDSAEFKAKAKDSGGNTAEASAKFTK